MARNEVSDRMRFAISSRVREAKVVLDASVTAVSLIEGETTSRAGGMIDSVLKLWCNFDGKGIC